MSNSLTRLDDLIKEIKENTPWYENLYYSFLRRWDDLTFIPQEIKAFYQRGRQGWAEMDTWSLDDYLIRLLPAAIRMVRDTSSSYNPDFESLKEWKKYLTKMANKIEQGKYISSEIATMKKMEKSRIEFEEGMQMFTKYFFSLWT